MADRPKLNSSNVSILNPGMRPMESPVDWQAMTADEFQQTLERIGCRYEWLAGPGDSAYAWSVVGAYSTKESNRAVGNRMYTRLRLEGSDGEELAVINLSAQDCVNLSKHLLEFAIASANVNNEHAVVADSMTSLLQGFMAPAKFAAFQHSLQIAAEESISAKLRIKAALNAKA
jgi:hypothetical protein